jgi:hypothetical protein
MFGWLSVDHLFSFLCCNVWLVEYCSTNQTLQQRKLKWGATLNQPNITTQKTKKVSNTQPTKHYNKENKKGEQHSHHFSFLCCNVWLVDCCSPF